MSRVTPLPNGPLKIEDASLVDAEGNVVKEGTLVLCRCGHSANKPFCDGSHTGAGFTSD